MGTHIYIDWLWGALAVCQSNIDKPHVDGTITVHKQQTMLIDPVPNLPKIGLASFRLASFRFTPGKVFQHPEKSLRFLPNLCFHLDFRPLEKINTYFE